VVNLKFFFICTLESGRVKPDDVTTIRLILDSIKIPFTYGIIINKVLKETKIKLLENNGKNLVKVLACLNDEKYSTTHVYINEYYSELHDKNDKLIQMNNDFYDFIRKLPSMIIQNEDVMAINVQDYNGILEENEILIKQLQDDNKILVNRINNLNKNGFWDNFTQGVGIGLGILPGFFKTFF